MSQAIFPALRYRDVDAAIEWLGAAFGATADVVYRDDSGGVQHAQISIEGDTVMLSPRSEDGFLGGSSPDPLASTVSLYVVVADPDAHHARAIAASAEVVRALDDMDYGSREYSVRDPEGNLWSFGTYAP